MYLKLFFVFIVELFFWIFTLYFILIFLITVYFQYYFVLVSGAQHST